MDTSDQGCTLGSSQGGCLLPSLWALGPETPLPPVWFGLVQSCLRRRTGAGGAPDTGERSRDGGADGLGHSYPSAPQCTRSLSCMSHSLVCERSRGRSARRLSLHPTQGDSDQVRACTGTSGAPRVISTPILSSLRAPTSPRMGPHGAILQEQRGFSHFQKKHPNLLKKDEYWQNKKLKNFGGKLYSLEQSFI